MRALVFTTVFPSPWRPVHGLFVFERLRRLAELHDVRVVAPVPWMFRLRGRVAEPGRSWGATHPPFLYLPGLLKSLDAALLLLSALPAVRRIRREFDFDLIDAHFAYPDGLAAVLLGWWFARPVVVTVRGTEIELCRDSWWRRRAIGWALRRAALVIAVSRELSELARTLGVPAGRIAVVPNGVDSAQFRPRDRRASRRQLGIDDAGAVLVTVGHLVPRKGFHRVIDALPQVLSRRPDARLAIVGGRVPVARSYEAQLKARVARAGLESRVIFTGAVAPGRVALWLAAADLFVLATDREGSPNAVWEALACGVPVVSTRAGEIENMVPSFGGALLDDPEDVGALAAAIDRALERAWDRDAIRRHAERHTWQSIARRVDDLWQAAIGAPDTGPGAAAPGSAGDGYENVIVGR